MRAVILGQSQVQTLQEKLNLHLLQSVKFYELSSEDALALLREAEDLGLLVGAWGTSAPARIRSRIEWDVEDSSPNWEQLPAAETGLEAHLLRQLGELALQPAVFELAKTIISHLDEDGYFRADLSILASEFSESCAKEALEVVQSLTPVGIAARDGRECLLIQAEALYGEDALCCRLLRECVDYLEMRDLKGVAESLGVSIDDVERALRRLRRLSPAPGRFFSRAALPVRPELRVMRSSRGGYLLQLVNDNLPLVRIHPGLTKARSGDRKLAEALVTMVHQRRRLLLAIGEVILEVQGRVLEEGWDALVPLSRRDVAARLAVHESTVGRVVQDSWLQTETGAYPLSRFFCSGFGDVAVPRIKKRICELIQGENPQKPLSDQALVRLLEQEGVHVSRRTLQKYREGLGIGSSTARRRRD